MNYELNIHYQVHESTFQVGIATLDVFYQLMFLIADEGRPHPNVKSIKHQHYCNGEF